MKNTVTFKNHTKYSFNDYSKYIKNAAYSFSKKTGIDIDDFISEAGLQWTLAIKKHNCQKCDFIVYFKTVFRQSCIKLITKQYTKKRSIDINSISIDKDISDNNKMSLHDVISSDISSNNLMLLSDTAKQMLSMIAEYQENKSIKNNERKKLINKNNSLIKKTMGLKNYRLALQEICELSPGMTPAKQNNTFPVIY